MNIVLLSGGSGKRLWPLSNEVRSKQFIKIFNGGKQSMVERVYCQIKNADPEARITIATSKSQVSAIHNQLGSGVAISIEPCRRDTFPAIALAAAYLHDVEKISKDEVIVVCPVDPYVDDGYFETLKKLALHAANAKANITLMGIEPTYPSEKYGYIIPENKADISKVTEFKEKPDKVTAERYISRGALWNGGVFAFKLDYLLQKSSEILGVCDYWRLLNGYADFKKISFDYAVVEREKRIDVLRYNGEWKDLGTWNTLTEVMEQPVIGKGIMNENCKNVHIVNETGMPIVAMGLKDVVISASPDGILISDKEQSSYIKPFVDGIEQQIMFAEKSWGSYRVLDADKNSLTIKVTLKEGCAMNYHSHCLRDEVWVVISGKGRTTVDGMEQEVSVGDVITVQRGCKHKITAVTHLQLVEVQLGEEITVGDKIKYGESGEQ